MLKTAPLVLALLLVSVWGRAQTPVLDAEQSELFFRLIERSGRRQAASGDPLYSGLPDEIPRDYPEREGFVRFAHVDGDFPPIGARIRISVPGLGLRDVFEDESWARLPDGKQIGRDASGAREVWDYPVGTRVAHRLLFKSDPPRLFELRLAQKRTDGKWAFGIYKDEGGPSELPLHRDGMPPLSFDLMIKGQPVRVEMLRLNPASCRTCHFRMGHGGYQYPDVDHAGPCGFSPPNPRLLTEWAAAYQARHGHFPFVETRPKGSSRAGAR